MKKCYIFAGGEFDGFFDQIKNEDYIIGADKGYTYTKKIGLEADEIIGDFDSSKEPDFKEKTKLKPEKDETDLYAAINIAIKKGYKKIIVYRKYLYFYFCPNRKDRKFKSYKFKIRIKKFHFKKSYAYWRIKRTGWKRIQNRIW